MGLCKIDLQFFAIDFFDFFNNVDFNIYLFIEKTILCLNKTIYLSK